MATMDDNAWLSGVSAVPGLPVHMVALSRSQIMDQISTSDLRVETKVSQGISSLMASALNEIDFVIDDEETIEDPGACTTRYGYRHVNFLDLRHLPLNGKQEQFMLLRYHFIYLSLRQSHCPGRWEWHNLRALDLNRWYWQLRCPQWVAHALLTEGRYRQLPTSNPPLLAAPQARPWYHRHRISRANNCPAMSWYLRPHHRPL